MRPYLKKPIAKKGWWSGSRCRRCRPSLSSNPRTNKKKKKRRKKKRKEGREEGRKEREKYAGHVF
jgi:hypothetical protein